MVKCRRLFGRIAAVGLAGTAAVAAVAVAPAAATSGPPLTYTANADLACVLGPNALSVQSTVAAGLSVTAPAFVEDGDQITLQSSSAALSVPVQRSFALPGATEIGGTVSSLPLDVSQTGEATQTINAAQQSPYNALSVLEIGPGLPFGPDPVGAGPALSLSFPVSTTPQIDTTTNAPANTPYDQPTGTPATFNVGPFTISGAPGGAVTRRSTRRRRGRSTATSTR